ncbi:MAG: ribbon-helix-helix protein, CopG family [Actinomycetota bacterium]
MDLSYPALMTRRQVIVQLDDTLVSALDEAAAQEHVSRSELLRRAALALLEARRMVKLERELIDAYRRIPQDPVLIETARRLAAVTAPPW